MLTLPEIRCLTSGRHLARMMIFEELYSGLQKRVSQGYINVQSDPSHTKEIYSYSNSCTYDKAWDQFTLIARGLVLDPVQKRVLCFPFPKFFNFGELGYDFPDEPFTVSSKMDGSLGIISFYDDQWNVVTRGSFTSDQAKWAKQWLTEHVKLDVLHPGYTYLAEIIYSANRIVVAYPFEGLVLLSAYNEWGDEMPRKYIEDIGSEAGMKVVEIRSFGSLSEIVDVAKTLPYNDEGFVVKFADGFRLKIKGEEYARIARLVARVTPLGIWDLMVAKDDLEEVKKVLPEEFQVDFDKIRCLLEEKFFRFRDTVLKATESVKDLTDKELGQALQSGTLKFSPEVSSFIFACRKKNLLDKVEVAGRDRSAFFRIFRPTGNKLEGYQPSNVMNRFAQESE